MKPTASKPTARSAKSSTAASAPNSGKSRQGNGAKVKTSATNGSGTESPSSTWECGHPKSTGNAFDWRRVTGPSDKPTFGAKRGPKGRGEKTVKEIKVLATRVNKHDPITKSGAMNFDARQKLLRAEI